ncbi:MAG: hypothetical protein R6U61_01440 [Thermoplasmata archaeon]
MINNFLEEVCGELKDIDVDYIVVGGSAIESRGWDIGTEDLDFVLTAKGFSDLEIKLKGSPRFKVIDRIKTMVETEFMHENTWRTVEFIDPRYFSGKKTADEFVDYVKRYRSTKEKIGHVADPEVVFFMRLMVGDWEIYVQKILRDIRAGLPVELLDDVVEISDTLGVKEKMEPRVEYTKEIIEVRL